MSSDNNSFDSVRMLAWLDGSNIVNTNKWKLMFLPIYEVYYLFAVYTCNRRSSMVFGRGQRLSELLCTTKLGSVENELIRATTHPRTEAKDGSLPRSNINYKAIVLA